MYSIEDIAKEITELIAKNKIYESYQLFESWQFRFLRRCGLDDTLVLFADIFPIYAQISEGKYQLEIIKSLWSNVNFQTNVESIGKIIRTEAVLVSKASVYEPKDEWDQTFNIVIAKAHTTSNTLCDLFRNSVFQYYIRFRENSKALKHCVFGQNEEEIASFLSNYAINNLPRNEWDILIADYVLQILTMRTPQIAKNVFDMFLSHVKQPLNLSDCPPYEPILLNYAQLITDAAMENKPDIIATIQKTYLPALKQKDKALVTHFDLMYTQCYPDSVSRNNLPQSTNNLFNVIAGEIFGQNSTNSSNPARNNSNRNHDFGLD